VHLHRQAQGTNKLAMSDAGCRHHGLPLTGQRRVILDARANAADHPTVDEILEQGRARLPGVSRPTVYRALGTLVQLGLAVTICSAGTGVPQRLREFRIDAETASEVCMERRALVGSPRSR